MTLAEAMACWLGCASGVHQLGISHTQDDAVAQTCLLWLIGAHSSLTGGVLCAGEAGDTDHVVSAFMLCENIAHGITLRKSPCIQYLFYLAQVSLTGSNAASHSV